MGPPPFLPSNFFILGELVHWTTATARSSSTVAMYISPVLLCVLLFCSAVFLMYRTVEYSYILTYRKLYKPYYIVSPVGVLLIAFVTLQFYNGAYKRLANEALKHPLLDAENGAANPLQQQTAGALGMGSPTAQKIDSALVRVTSLDSGSGNGNSGMAIGELSVAATNSINMWQVRGLVVSLVCCYCC